MPLLGGQSPLTGQREQAGGWALPGKSRFVPAHVAGLGTAPPSALKSGLAARRGDHRSSSGGHFPGPHLSPCGVLSGPAPVRNVGLKRSADASGTFPCGTLRVSERQRNGAGALHPRLEPQQLFLGLSVLQANGILAKERTISWRMECQVKPNTSSPSAASEIAR